MVDRILFALILICVALPDVFGSEAPRPNILYIYVDDMGWGSIGPNGQWERKEKGLPHLITPNLDRLAREGVNFTRSYGCTVCSPARSSQQSGFHQGHTFADRNDPDNAKKAMRADDVLMGDALSKAGYTTGYWGKWGYGGSKSQPNPVIENVQTLPTSHGYQHVAAELHHVRAHTFFQPTLWAAPAPKGSKGGMYLIPNSLKPIQGNQTYPEEPALQNDPRYPKTAYCDDVYAFAALDFVRKGAKTYRDSGKPFFGLLAVQVPHAPFGEIEQLPEWDKAYRDLPFFSQLNDQSKQWAAMVTRIDGHIGNLLNALEDPDGDGNKDDSIASNTLVIFQSDNGGPQHKAREEFAANGGLRGQKGQIHEGGIRIPTLMRWPGVLTDKSQLKPGTSTDIVLDVSDLLPTFCELADIPAPLSIDGVSIAPTITGQGQQRHRAFLIHEAGRSQSIIEGNTKLVKTGKNLSLYNLKADSSEKNDLANDMPEEVARLEKLLIGERATEPKGFANTYHRWTGPNGGKASDPENWSDYTYANEGITYTTDKGAPRSSWTATINNKLEEDRYVLVDKDLEFLGLEVSGDKAWQILLVDDERDVHGRNEIRVGMKGTIHLKDGSLSSLRWIEVREGASILGSGRIDATVYTSGAIKLKGNMTIGADFHQSPEGQLAFLLDEAPQAQLQVKGSLRLSGRLAISGTVKESRRKLVSAKEILGQFDNPENIVTSPEGRKYKISYEADAVYLNAL